MSSHPEIFNEADYRKAECETHKCSYYRHYLAYSEPGQPDLSHDAYHAADAECERWQRLAQQWDDEHPELSGEQCRRQNPYERECVRWEEKVRA